MIKKFGIFFGVVFVGVLFVSNNISGQSIEPEKEKKEEVKKEEKPKENVVVEGANKEENKEAQAKSEGQKNYRNPTICLSDPIVLEDIQTQKKELEKRKEDLDTKEKEIEKMRAQLETELKKIGEVRTLVQQDKLTQDQQFQTKVTRVVETVEKMSPKAASKLISNLDEKLAVEAMSKITTQKLAKIMNLMDIKDSSKLTEMMTGIRQTTPQKGIASEKKGVAGK